MFKQLTRLSIDADGRYASDGELQFLQDYLDSAELRMSAYEKAREHEEQIIYRWEAVKHGLKQDTFHMGERDVTEICRRDMTNIFRCSVTAVLFNDLDRLREGLLIWYQTIVRAYNYTQYAKISYQVIQDVIKEFLTPEEANLVLPALKLDHTILSS
ncbi:MAG: allophycocyanin [Cyanobacteriota bacterium]|nr:allophycocyanin [Cyanobacteriota bacterium]